MAEINWTFQAEHWLEKIHTYISQVNPSIANKTVDDIYEFVQHLETNTELGFPYRKKPEKNIRILLYGHYRIAYTIKDQNKRIDILGVYHGAMDIDAQL